MSEPLRSLDGIFRPRNVAVVGASDQPGSIGQKLMANLLSYGFQGPVFPVNPRRRVVHSIKAYGRVSDIPERVDLVIIAVPRDGVLEVVEDCAAAGTRGIVTITAGFKETGEEGRELEQRIAAICRASGMRLVGPNCMGVINSDPTVRLLGSFSGDQPMPGNAAFLSQSGALGEAIIAHAGRIGVGISMFASLGNKADVGADDLLEYWDADERTGIILMYLESFGAPRRFIQLAREISKRKPIVAVKAGRTAHGARAAASHTGSLAGADLAIDAMMAQCGVLRASSIEELFDMASVLASQPLPQGKRLAIITNAGGPGILATDAAETLGLDVATHSAEVQAKLRAVLPKECTVAGPVDLIASAEAERYRLALEVVAASDDADLFLVIFVSPVMIDAAAVAREVVAFKESSGRPVVACVMGKLGEDRAVDVLKAARVPTFVYPESAVRGLHALTLQADWVRRPPSAVRSFADVDPARARAALAPIVAAGGGDVPPEACAEVLAAYGITLAATVVATSEPQAIAAAKEFGSFVAMKVAPLAELFRHKSDIGGVRVGVRGDDEVRQAYGELAALSREHGGDGRVLIQQMLGPGKELILGLQTDPQFGHLIMVGAGGIYVEYTRDVVFRVAPIDQRDAREMLESLRTYPILGGVRGEKPSAIEVATLALERLSALASDVPEILELDLNPFILTPDAAHCGAVDARIRVSGGR